MREAAEPGEFLFPAAAPISVPRIFKERLRQIRRNLTYEGTFDGLQEWRSHFMIFVWETSFEGHKEELAAFHLKITKYVLLQILMWHPFIWTR